mgnify:CR=1 FL=1
MIVRIKFKKLANHWYPCLNHNSPLDLSLCEKAERILSYLDKDKREEIELTIIEQGIILDESNLLQFDEQDITRFFTTDDYFDMKVYINNHVFEIPVTLYMLLEEIYHFDFHENFFKIEIW